MLKSSISFAFFILYLTIGVAQETIPLDTLHWDINARAYVLEPFKGKNAIYLQRGAINLKNESFLNGTIEYDIYIKETRGFPGVFFRTNGSDSEQFYIRPHQSGNPDANQALGRTKGVSPWQLYHGDKYSFPYKYPMDKWMHVKIVVHDDKAQVYLDNAEEPNLSWQLFHEPKAGGIGFTGGGVNGIHLANFKINKENHTIKNFNPGKSKPIEGAIAQWEISDKFQEDLLNNTNGLGQVIANRKWDNTVVLEEGVAANISRKVQLRNDRPGNTVFARITITATKDETRLFEFGYSDRVVVLLLSLIHI